MGAKSGAAQTAQMATEALQENSKGNLLSWVQNIGNSGKQLLQKIWGDSKESNDAISSQKDGSGNHIAGQETLVTGNSVGVKTTLNRAAVETAAMSGHGPEARRLLERLPGQAPPGLYALVVASETFGQRGVDELDEIFHREPDRFHARWLAFALHAGGRLDQMVGHLHRIPSTDRHPAVVDAAADIADWAGDPVVAADLRSLSVS